MPFPPRPAWPLCRGVWMSVVTALVRVAPPRWVLTPARPQVLIDWINEVLVEERIIVKQLEEDLYDGQVLQKLLGESAGGRLRPSPAGPQRRAA